MALDSGQGLQADRAWISLSPLAAAVEVPGSGPRPGRLVPVSGARFADAEGFAFESNAAILTGLVVWAAGVEGLPLVEEEEEMLR